MDSYKNHEDEYEMMITEEFEMMTNQELTNEIYQMMRVHNEQHASSYLITTALSIATKVYLERFPILN